MKNYLVPLLSRPRLLWLLLALVVAIIGGVWKFAGDKSADKKHKQEKTVAVKVVPASRKDVPVYLQGLGTVQAYNTVTLRSRVEGELIAILFEEGQQVKAGDVLAKIDPRSYQAQYAQAVANKAKNEAQLENAKRDLKRYKDLGEMVSAQTTDTQRATVSQLEAALKSDQAAIDNAKTSLSYTVITSPINGRTGIRQVDVGNIVGPSESNGLVVITQLQPISVLFSLPQEHLIPIKQSTDSQGKLQVIAQDANEGLVLDTGVLELVDNQIDQNTGTIRLKATFPNPKQLLWPGGFVNVKLLLTTRKNSLVVPAIAIQQGPKGPYVFQLTPENTVIMKPVKIALTEKDDAVIETGLEENVQVVIDGAAQLKEGAKVTVMESGTTQQ